MPLPRKAKIDSLFEAVQVNVFDLATKEIVFTGGVCQVATFLNISQPSVQSYLKSKARFRKKYALRMAKVNNENI